MEKEILERVTDNYILPSVLWDVSITLMIESSYGLIQNGWFSHLFPSFFLSGPSTGPHTWHCWFKLDVEARVLHWRNLPILCNVLTDKSQCRKWCYILKGNWKVTHDKLASTAPHKPWKVAERWQAEREIYVFLGSDLLLSVWESKIILMCMQK